MTFEELKFIMVFFGSVISLLLFIIGFFLRVSHTDMKTMLARHDEMLNAHQTDIALLKDRQIQRK